MNEISNKVLAYYKEHFDELSELNQFHLASRLYLWAQDSWSSERLTLLKPYFTCKDHPEKAVLQAAKLEHGINRLNAYEARRPFFDKYPLLREYSRACFKVNFLLSIYKIDARDQIIKMFGIKHLQQLSHQLLDDPEGVAILSTFAVNYLYFYSRLIANDYSIFTPDYFFNLASKFYNDASKQDLQLKIYLYTHCIIGETGFYFKKIDNPGLYVKMLLELENLIDNHFDDVNLDNKFEFLVCSRILGHRSRIEGRIYNEAVSSFSASGNFVIDTHNNNKQIERSDINRSEHRNILLIMSAQDFLPIG